MADVITDAVKWISADTSTVDSPTNYSGPLSSLYKSDATAISSMVYPSDLGSMRRKHWVNFYISVPEKSSYAKTQIPLIPGISLNSSTNTTAGVNQFVENATTGNLTAINDFDNPSLESKLYKWTVTPGTTKLTSVVSLYMPDTFAVDQHAMYDTVSLTEALGTLGGAAGIADEAVKSLQDAISLTGNNGNALSNLGAFGTLIAEGLSSGILNDPNIALRPMGRAVNPQMELMFKKIDFRTFQFHFVFTPKSRDEALTVQNIIKTFRLHAAPEIDYGTAGGRYFIVPSVFEIEVFFDGQPNKAVSRIATCALETIRVDYAQHGWVTHDDGMPVQTHMTLQFKEMDLMTKDKINAGY